MSAAARAREQVRVVHAIVVEGTGKRLHYVVLTDDFSQRCRAVFAVQGEAHDATLRGGADSGLRVGASRVNQCPTSNFSQSTTATASTTPAM